MLLVGWSDGYAIGRLQRRVCYWWVGATGMLFVGPIDGYVICRSNRRVCYLSVQSTGMLFVGFRDNIPVPNLSIEARTYLYETRRLGIGETQRTSKNLSNPLPKMQAHQIILPVANPSICREFTLVE